MLVFFIMLQYNNIGRDEMAFMEMKPYVHYYADSLCLAYNLENNNSETMH